MTGPRRYLVAAALVIAALTLPPTHAPAETQFLVENAAADFARNILLFMPLGLALACGGSATRTAVFDAFLFSATIELLQIVIPGRDPSLLDVTANTIGAAAGALLWMSRRSVRRAPRWAGGVAALLPVAMFALGAWMAQPSLPANRLYRDDWTPDLEERYRGKMLGATLGTDSLRPWRPSDPERLRARLLGDVDLTVRGVAGPRPSRRAVLVRVYDEAQTDIMDLAVERDDLLWRLRSRSVVLRFEQPVVSWLRALGGVAAGDTLRLHLRRRKLQICATIQGLELCSALRAAEIWTILVARQTVPARLRPMIGWLSLMLAVLPVGLLAKDKRTALIAIPVLAVVMVAGPRFAGLEALDAPDWIAAAAGVTIGALLRSLVGQDGQDCPSESSRARGSGTMP